MEQKRSDFVQNLNLASYYLDTMGAEPSRNDPIRLDMMYFGLFSVFRHRPLA